jgi:PAS domain S-box-containing protein
MHPERPQDAAPADPQATASSVQRAGTELSTILLDSMTEGVSLSAEDGTIVYTNPAEDRMFGYEPGELVGRHVSVQNAYPPEQNERIVGEVIAELKEYGSWRGEWLNRRKDGSVFTTRSRISAVDIDGRRHWLCVQEDVTDQTAATAALRQSEASLRLAMDTGRMALWSLDLVTDTIDRSPELNRLLGFPPDAALCIEEIRARYAPGERERLQAAGREALARGERFIENEFRYLRPDGSERWLMLRAEAQFDVEGKPVRAVGVLMDIDDRKRAELALKESEEALRASEARLRLAVEAGRIGEWELDVASDTSVRALRHDQIFGYNEPVKVWGFETFIAHVLPEDREGVESAFKTAAEKGTGWNFECRIRRAGDGAIRWIAAHSVPQMDDSGRVRRMFGLVQDVTEQRQAQERLRQLNETLEAQVAERTAERDRIWVHSNDLMGVFGFDGRRRAINPAWSRILGFDEETLLNTPFNEITHPDDRASLALAVQRLARGEKIVSFEDRLRDKDGQYHTISWTGVPAGELFYAIGRDVTEQRQAEEALRQAQKMEAVGQLTGGIAHDFNNMLAVVIGGLDLLQRRLARGETDVGRYIEAAMDGATRAASLTQRLLAFSRQQPLQPEPVTVNRIVSGMSELLTRTIGEDILVETVLSAGLWKTNVDPSQLENTLLNLAVNARDAMPGGGKLTIETANAHVDDHYAREFEIEPGQYVLICVTDTGTGMTPEVLAKAFEPFFTTKGVGKGTGLGLSQVFGFVRQSGGHVKIYSEPGHGTTVKIYLPRFYGAAPSEAPKRVVAQSHGGELREIVMVVEDEERVRRYSVEALRDLGYTVVHAASGREALRMIDQGQDVTLLFTDIVMPEMTGRELANLALASLPRLKVLFTTGYTRNAVVHNGVLDPGTNFLPKPFGIEELAAKVRSVLDSADAD